MKVTELELQVLKFTAAGDPWNGKAGRVGSRVRSGALGRLQKKGLVGLVYDDGWKVTEAGEKLLKGA